MLARSVSIALIALGAGLSAAPPVPRPAQELKILEPSGKQTLLSSYKGKVVLVQFLYTSCSHCQRTARLFSKLQQEYGKRGLQVLGVAFNEEVLASPQIVSAFIREHDVKFPVGVAKRETALGYLGISVMTRMGVPQILVVDRNGMIQAQTEPIDSGMLQDETALRALLERLLASPITAR